MVRTDSSASRSAAGPSRTTRPVRMTEPRSACRSASRASCSTSRMVTPCARSSSSAEKISAMTSGARPSDGSSSSSSRGSRHERATDGEHLLLAARERLGRLVRALLQHREERVDPRQGPGGHGAPVAAGAVGAELEVLAHGHRAEQQPALGHERQALAHEALGPRRGDAGAAVGDRPRADGDEADDGLEQRRLAGAVRADDGDELALADGEVDVVQHLGVAVAGPDRRELEQRGGVRHRRPPRRRGRRRSPPGPSGSCAAAPPRSCGRGRARRSRRRPP